MLRLTRFIGLGYIGVCLLALAATALLGPLGYAPLRLPIGPAREPVVVTIWYGTEKKDWLEAAVRQFAATSPAVSGRPVEIVLRGLGSRELALRAARQEWQSDGAPTAIAPASSAQIELLRAEWEARSPGAEPIVAHGSGGPQPLALTPLVVVGWEQRAGALWPNGPGNIWAELHDAASNPQGWRGIPGGREEWGFVKLGQASPVSSNSGAQALILMTYGYHEKTGGLTPADVADPDFQRWLAELQAGVSPPSRGGALLSSTGPLMDDIVLAGPSIYDFGIVYENLALQSIDRAARRQGQALRIFYPPATMLSDHPYAVLQAPWVSREQRAAAAEFGRYLLSRPAQELALSYGLRPADPGVSLSGAGPNNPFERYRQHGARVDIAQQVETPPAEVTTALIELWQRSMSRRTVNR